MIAHRVNESQVSCDVVETFRPRYGGRFLSVNAPAFSTRDWSWWGFRVLSISLSSSRQTVVELPPWTFTQLHLKPSSTGFTRRSQRTIATKYQFVQEYNKRRIQANSRFFRRRN